MECTSFPFALRAAMDLVKEAVVAKKPTDSLIRGISILGPQDRLGDRTKYSYAAALELGKTMNIITERGVNTGFDKKKNFY